MIGECRGVLLGAACAGLVCRHYCHVCCVHCALLLHCAPLPCMKFCYAPLPCMKFCCALPYRYCRVCRMLLCTCAAGVCVCVCVCVCGVCVCVCVVVFGVACLMFSTANENMLAFRSPAFSHLKGSGVMLFGCLWHVLVYCPVAHWVCLSVLLRLCGHCFSFCGIVPLSHSGGFVQGCVCVKCDVWCGIVGLRYGEVGGCNTPSRPWILQVGVT